MSFGPTDTVPPSDIETVGSNHCGGAAFIVDFPHHAEWIIGSFDADFVAAGKLVDDFIGETMLVLVDENDAEESGLPAGTLFDAECDEAFAPAVVAPLLLREPIDVLCGVGISVMVP